MKKALKTLLAIILFLSVVAAVVPCKTITQEEPSASESPSVHVLSHSYEEHSTDSTFHIHYIDVGQADAALVECDGHYMLIDGGNRSDSDKIYSILKQKEIKHLDIVIGTHAHEDHIGGLPGALNYAKADVIFCPVTEYDSEAFQDFVTYANKNGPGICIPSAGAEYKLGSASIKILGVNSGSDTNDTSIVLKICYGNTAFLSVPSRNHAGICSNLCWKKKFHYPACKSVKQMKDKNKREYTGIRKEVIEMGYDPCGNCHP